MRACMLPLALVTACVTPVTRTPPASQMPGVPQVDALRERIATTIAKRPGADVAVYYQDLARPDSLRLNADLSFHAASTMKVPVMIELFRRVDSGTLSLDQTVPVVNRFPSLVDGTPFSLDSADDSDVSLYRRVGGTATFRELNELMIAHSSNFATNLMLARLDPKAVNATAHALGARNMTVLRGVEDDKAFAKGLNNTTTARDLGVLLTGIERGTVASRRSCSAMKSVLLEQEFSTEIPAGLPPGVRVAHKTGWITGTRHDAAIVYPPGRPPYVLVVLTRNIPVVKDAQQLIATISREVYDFNASR
ncbi:MAG: serine hydrolase [Gemmatimonadaceae bacterium]